MYISSFPTYLSVCIYILTKSEFISSCSRPAVGSNIVQITHTNFFCKCFLKKWPPVAILDVQKITFGRISGHFRSIRNFLKKITKWLPSAILDVRNSLWITFLAILDQYRFFLNVFYKIAPGGHFGCHFWPFQIDTQLYKFF